MDQRNAATPQRQVALQLVAADRLQLNPDKPVPAPQGRQILAKVLAVGLCFSDLKLLKQFDQHPRKGEIVDGIERDVLEELPSYVPGTRPTVPGHEAVCQIVAVGDAVQQHRVGERVIIQADYRQLPTAGSNAAFGYNLEGALQEYVLLDERIVVDARTSEHFLIPVEEATGRSAVALVEPWACVENSYRTAERRTIKAGGRLLVMVDTGHSARGLAECFSPDGPPASIAVIAVETAQVEAVETLGPKVESVQSPDLVDDQGFDDIVYFGTSKLMIDTLNDKLAAGGIFCIVADGRRIGEKVSVGVGRVHYGGTRWIGTPTASAADAYARIPATGEIRPGDRVVVIGAGGPMGQMHTIRALSVGLEGVRVVATDVDDDRLAALSAKTADLAASRGVEYGTVNTRNQPLEGELNYFALMAPLGVLVEQAIDTAAPGALINIFAGIPAPVRHDLDMDAYIDKGLFMFGTSGSRIDDMRAVLESVQSGRLDTNISVDAVSGMAGAAEGIAAVEQRSIAGKIIVYPELHEMPLTPLHELERDYPTVAAKLAGGVWTRQAEDELLKVAR